MILPASEALQELGSPLPCNLIKENYFTKLAHLTKSITSSLLETRPAGRALGDCACALAIHVECLGYPVLD